MALLMVKSCCRMVLRFPGVSSVSPEARASVDSGGGGVSTRGVLFGRDDPALPTRLFQTADAESLPDRTTEASNSTMPQESPCRKNRRARSRETDPSRRLSMRRGGYADDTSDQIVGQERRPEFVTHHFRGLATQVVQV